jgi:hypothetical protein
MSRHHYVPRMLLKNFSVDVDKKYLNMHLLKNDHFKYRIPLYDQAQENNLYGSDQKLEKFYGGLESAASICLDKLNTGNVDLEKEEHWHIKLFIVNQISRTPGFVSSQDDSIEKLLKNMASHDKFLKDHLDDFSVSLNKPYNMYSSFSLDLLFIILDLKLGLLESSNKNAFFVIGKNPVILLNPFLKEKNNWKWSTKGLAQKGISIIMPISPRFSLILYDSLRYTLINKNPKWVISDSNVEKLNDFQYCNTDECIYFAYPIDEQDYIQKNNCFKKFRESNKAIFEIINSFTDEKTGERIEISRFGTEEYPIKQNFDFLAIKAAEYEKPVYDRNDAKREHVDDINLWRKEILSHIKSNME